MVSHWSFDKHGLLTTKTFQLFEEEFSSDYYLTQTPTTPTDDAVLPVKLVFMWSVYKVYPLMPGRGEKFIAAVLFLFLYVRLIIFCGQIGTIF